MEGIVLTGVTTILAAGGGFLGAYLARRAQVPFERASAEEARRDKRLARIQACIDQVCSDAVDYWMSDHGEERAQDSRRELRIVCGIRDARAHTDTLFQDHPAFLKRSRDEWVEINKLITGDHWSDPDRPRLDNVARASRLLLDAIRHDIEVRRDQLPAPNLKLWRK